MMPNWSRFSGLQSGLAPTSRTTQEPVAVGKTGASPGRSTPGISPSRKKAVTEAAPVFPAVTKASAWPFLTRSIPIAIEFFAFGRRAFSTSAMPLSSMVSISGACTTRMGRFPGFWAASTGRTCCIERMIGPGSRRRIGALTRLPDLWH